MGAEVEVKLSRMRDPHIHRSSSGNVATLADLFLLVGTEEPRVVPLLHHNERDARTVVLLQLHARLPDCQQLV